MRAETLVQIAIRVVPDHREESSVQCRRAWGRYARYKGLAVGLEDLGNSENRASGWEVCCHGSAGPECWIGHAGIKSGFGLRTVPSIRMLCAGAIDVDDLGGHGAAWRFSFRFKTGTSLGAIWAGQQPPYPTSA